MSIFTWSKIALDFCYMRFLYDLRGEKSFNLLFCLNSDGKTKNNTRFQMRVWKLKHNFGQLL